MQIEISLLQHMISISTRSMFLAPAPQILTPFPPRPALWGGGAGGGGGVPRPVKKMLPRPSLVETAILW